MKYLVFLLLCTGMARADTLTMQGIPRSYDVVMPVMSPTPAPLLIVLHGGGGTAAKMRHYVALDDLTAAAGVITVYPQGRDRNWNDGRIGQDGQPLSTTDDVAFLDAIITTLVQDGRVDPDAVYLAGMSNGGMMALRMACDAQHPIAGIAVIAANMPVGLECPVMRPLHILHVIGRDDPILPFAGGDIVARTDKGAVRSAVDTFETFARANGCSTARSQALPDTDPTDGTTVLQITGRDCTSGKQTLAYGIAHGGHTWPGAQPLARWLLGATSQDISASQLIVTLFFN